MDFVGLSQGSGKAFDASIRSIPSSLTKETVKQFFDLSIRLINSSIIEARNKSLVLIAVCKTIMDEQYLQEFLQGNYLNELPYDSEPINEQLFDLFYIIAQSAPLSLTDDIISKFVKLIPLSPKKALAVLTNYSKNFDTVQNSNWQNTLDILINPEYRDYFRQPLYIKNYISLLNYIVDQFPEFRNEKFVDCWNSICSCLSVNNDESVSLCYWTLVKFYDHAPNPQELTFPTLPVSCHLRLPNVQNSALSLLLRFQPQCDDDSSSDLISSLVFASRQQINANYILVAMADTNENVAKFLIQDPSWMTFDLPTKIDTLRLFLIVMKHASLIGDLAMKNETLLFIRDLLQLNTPSIFSIVTTLIRRLPLDELYIKRCNDFGILSTYFQYSFTRNEPLVIHSTLLLIDTFARIGYVHQLVDACDYVSQLILTGDKNNKQFLDACRVACDLGQYPKCATKFQQKKLDFFIKNKNDQKLKKASIQFTKSLRQAYENQQKYEITPKPAESKIVQSRIRRKDPNEEKMMESQEKSFTSEKGNRSSQLHSSNEHEIIEPNNQNEEENDNQQIIDQNEEENQEREVQIIEEEENEKNKNERIESQSDQEIIDALANQHQGQSNEIDDSEIIEEEESSSSFEEPNAINGTVISNQSGNSEFSSLQNEYNNNESDDIELPEILPQPQRGVSKE